MLDLALNEEFVNALLDKELELQKGFYEVLLDAVGDKLCFWGGIDIQRILPYGSPEEVE